MRVFTILCVVFLFSSCALFHTKKKEKLSYTSDETELESIVSILASDSLEGRLIASPGARKAAHLIQQKMQVYGLKPKGDRGSFLQAFPYTRIKHIQGRRGKMSTDTLQTHGNNVIGFHSNDSKYTVVIGAHFDYIGHGEIGFGMIGSGSGEIYNGADNNASGVGAILILARHAEALPKAFNYLFVAFSGEEYGFRGASYFVRNSPVPLEQVAFMINLDQVGRMRGSKLIVYGTGTSPMWKDVITEENSQNLLIEQKATGIGRSDHTVFFLVNIPALHLTTGKHFDSRKPSDDVELINWEGIEAVMEYTKYILKAAAPYGKPPFTATNEYKRKYQDKFKVTLGLMPDYFYTGEGLRVEVVIPDRSADRAGLKDGDIILQIGDIKIDNIYRYVDAIGKYKSGDQAQILYSRSGKEHKTTAVFIN